MTVFPDLESLSRAAADLFIQIGNEAIARHARFDVALSGGSTPKKMFELLATEEYRGKIDWSLVHTFWGDERYVPPTHELSNEHIARVALLSSVPIPEANIHGMYVEGGFDAAAEAYEELVIKQLGPELSLDLTLLGMGPDGHTASLFPDEPAVNEKVKLVVAGIGHAGISERITMTPPLLNRSRTVLFMVAGADKAAPLKRVLEGPEDWAKTPSQAIARHAPNIIWLVDNLAVADLNSTTL